MGNSTLAVRDAVAVGAALMANALDGVTTWVAITMLHAREAGVLAGPVVRMWGLAAALIVLKGGGALLIAGLALAGTSGEPRWWRVLPQHRWVVTAALSVAAAWFGLLAAHNALGVWVLLRLTALHR